MNINLKFTFTDIKKNTNLTVEKQNLRKLYFLFEITIRFSSYNTLKDPTV